MFPQENESPSPPIIGDENSSGEESSWVADRVICYSSRISPAWNPGRGAGRYREKSKGLGVRRVSTPALPPTGNRTLGKLLKFSEIPFP